MNKGGKRGRAVMTPEEAFDVLRGVLRKMIQGEENTAEDAMLVEQAIAVLDRVLGPMRSGNEEENK